MQFLLRSEKRELDRSNSGFSRNNKGFGSREDISERIVFKAPKAPSPVRGDKLNITTDRSYVTQSFTTCSTLILRAVGCVKNVDVASLKYFDGTWVELMPGPFSS